MYVLSVFLNYIHLASVFILVGTVFFIRFISTPLMRMLQREGDQHADGILIDAAVRFIKAASVIFLIIIVNGFIVMIMDDNYQGFFVIDRNDPWQVFMAIKHIVFVCLLASFACYALVVIKNKKLLDAGESTKSTGKLMDFLGLVNFIIVLMIVFCTSVTNYQYDWMKVVFYFFHLLLISCWIGGLFFVIFLGSPIIKARVIANQMPLFEGAHHLQMGASRFIKVLWVALFVSIFTGFPLLFIDAAYDRFFEVFTGVNLVMLIKHIVFLITILGAFVVTPTIARLQVVLKKTQHVALELTDEMKTEITKERDLILTGAKYGFSWLQLVLIISAVLDVIK